MRRLIAIFAALAIAPTAFAAADSELTHDAEYRARFMYQQNPLMDKDTQEVNSDVYSRFKMGFTFKSGEKFLAHATLIHAATFGSDEFGYPTGGTGDSGRATPDGVGNHDNVLLVNEAYGTWMVNDSFSVKVGRGGYTIGDGTVIARNDYEQTPYSFEGILGTYEAEAFRASAFAVKFAEYATNALAGGADDQQANLYGLNFDLKSLPMFLNMANLHVMSARKDETATGGAAAVIPEQSVLRYGLTLGGDRAGLDYRLTYAAETGTKSSAGTEQDVSTNMIHAEFGYSMEELMQSRFYVTYHTDTGSDGSADDTSYDSFFYDKHANAGFMDVVRWGNLTYFSVGYTLMPMDTLEVGLHYHMFSATEKNDNTDYSGNGYTRTAGEDALGSEIDLVATKKYDGGFELSTRLGMFTPGDGFAGEDTITELFLQGRMMF